MTGGGPTAAVLSEFLVAVVDLEPQMVWVGLFFGVLAGLLLVAYVGGRQLVRTDASESRRQIPARDDDHDAESGAATTSGRPAETEASVDDGHRQSEGSEREERQENRTHSASRASRDFDDGDRLLALLEESDGQLRQSRIVAETEWSKTKVSRTLSQLADENEVVKIQLGRENLICLPGKVPSIGRESNS